MTTALRGPLRNHFRKKKKKKRSQPYWGGENSGNALEASNALNYRVWGIPAVLSTGIPGNALRAFPEEIPEFLPEIPSRTGGVAHRRQSLSGHQPKFWPLACIVPCNLDRNDGDCALHSLAGPKVHSTEL